MIDAFVSKSNGIFSNLLYPPRRLPTNCHIKLFHLKSKMRYLTNQLTKTAPHGHVTGTISGTKSLVVLRIHVRFSSIYWQPRFTPDLWFCLGFQKGYKRFEVAQEHCPLTFMSVFMTEASSRNSLRSNLSGSTPNGRVK